MALGKYLAQIAGVITEVAANTTSAGSGDASKLVALNGAGQVDLTMMPTGIGPDTATLVASEALSAGNLVNVWSNGGAFNVRKADATAAGKEAHGFVLAAVSSSANALVYFNGPDTGLSALTPGVQYLSTTAGTCSATPPASTGNVVQRVGEAVSATVLNFTTQPPITLA
jgi:hypothetical protein